MKKKILSTVLIALALFAATLPKVSLHSEATDNEGDNAPAATQTFVSGFEEEEHEFTETSFLTLMDDGVDAHSGDGYLKITTSGTNWEGHKISTNISVAPQTDYLISFYIKKVGAFQDLYFGFNGAGLAEGWRNAMQEAQIPNGRYTRITYIANSGNNDNVQLYITPRSGTAACDIFVDDVEVTAYEPIPAGMENLLQNSAMETSSKWSTTGASIGFDYGDNSNRSFSMQGCGWARVNTGFHQNAEITAGIYVMSAYVRNSMPNNTSTVEIGMRTQDGTVRANNSLTFKGEGEFIQITVAYDNTAGLDSVISAYIKVTASQLADQSVWIDEVYLYRMKEASANLLTNSGFESDLTGWTGMGTGTDKFTANAFKGAYAVELNSATHEGYYYSVSGLKADTDYAFSVYARFATYSRIGFTEAFTLAAKGMQEIDSRIFNGHDFTTGYKRLMLTFNSGENSDVTLSFSGESSTGFYVDAAALNEADDIVDIMFDFEPAVLVEDSFDLHPRGLTVAGEIIDIATDTDFEVFDFGTTTLSSKAMVDADGRFTAVSAGRITIVVTCFGITKECVVSIKSSQNQSLEGMPAAKTNGVDKVVAVSSGAMHTLYLTADGEVYASGRNYHGQLGTGDYETRLTPIKIAGLANIIKVAAGGSHSLALDIEGNVYAWGDNYYAQIGVRHNFRPEPTPIKLEDLEYISDIAAGSIHSVVLSSKGVVYTFGGNTSGQLGVDLGTNTTNGTGFRSYEKQRIDGVFDLIAAGAEHTLAVNIDGALVGWGSNSAGQLGLADRSNFNQPVYAPAFAAGYYVDQIMAGHNTSYVLGADGSLLMLGDNAHGQMGMSSEVVAQSHEWVTSSKTNLTKILDCGLNNVLIQDADGLVYIAGNAIPEFTGIGAASVNTFVELTSLKDAYGASASNLMLVAIGKGYGEYIRSATLLGTTSVHKSGIYTVAAVFKNVDTAYSLEWYLSTDNIFSGVDELLICEFDAEQGILTFDAETNGLKAGEYYIFCRYSTETINDGYKITFTVDPTPIPDEEEPTGCGKGCNSNGSNAAALIFAVLCAFAVRSKLAR